MDVYVHKFVELHSDLEHLDLDQRTPLYYALKGQNYEIVKVLLAARTSPWTPLVQSKYTYTSLTSDKKILSLLKNVRKVDLLMKMCSCKRKK